MTYRFEGGGDMTTLFTLDATYVRADGRTATERIASLPWSRNVSASLPFDARLNVKFTPVAEFEQKSLYHIGFDGYIDYTTSDGLQSGPVRVSRAGNSRALQLRFTLPEGVSPEGVSLRVAPLKYDKHFAFTLTVDDSYVNAYSRIWSLIHGRWIDAREFYHLGRQRTTGYTPDHSLVMGDGCGNERPFGFSCAVWPTWGNQYNPTFVKDADLTGDNSQYLSWAELELMTDFGASVLLHNGDERIMTLDPQTKRPCIPAEIAQGFEADYQKTLEKLGIRTKVLGLPDGNRAYAEAAQLSDRVFFVRNSLDHANKIYLHACGDLRKQSTYGGVNSSDITVKLNELAAQASSGNPYWVALTVHRPQEDYMEMLETVCSLYGKPGLDNLWVASWDEVYEYVALREGAEITRSIEGRTVTFGIELPAAEGFLFEELTLLADGAAGATVEAVSDGITGLSHAVRGDAELVNVAFGERLPRLAEKYTSIYESEADSESLSNAQYFVSRLLPSLARPLEERIGRVVEPDDNHVTAAGARRYQQQYDGYVLEASVRIEAGKK